MARCADGLCVLLPGAGGAAEDIPGVPEGGLLGGRRCNGPVVMADVGGTGRRQRAAAGAPDVNTWREGSAPTPDGAPMW